MIELRKYALALSMLKPGDAVVDAGAFVGSFSFIYSSLIGPDGIVFAYEPQPHALKLLTANVQNKKSDNIRVSNRAVSAYSGQTIAMKVFADSAEQSCTIEPSLMYNERMPGSTIIIQVETQALDDLIDLLGFKHLNFIKIDTEGHEGEVIKGATNLLKKHQPVIVMEYGFVPGNYEPTTIKQLQSLDYICYDLKNMAQVEHGYISTSPTDLMAIPIPRIKELTPILRKLSSLSLLLRLKIFAHKLRLKIL